MCCQGRSEFRGPCACHLADVFFCSFSKFNFHLKTLRLNSSSLRVCPISYACMHPQAGRRYLNLVLLYHLSYHPVPLLCSPEVIVWDMQHQERIIPGGKRYSPGLSPSHSFTISPFFRLHLFIYLCQFVFCLLFHCHCLPNFSTHIWYFAPP